MPIDTSMYNANAGQNFVSSMGEGMRMGQLAHAQAQEQAMRDAYAKNVTQGPDGQLVVNRAGLLADAGKVDPAHALQLQSQLTANDRSQLEFKQQQIAQHMANARDIAQVTSGVKNQEQWEAALDRLQKSGHDVSGEPRQFDPAYRDNLLQTSQSYEQQLGEKHKTLSEQIEQRKADIEGKKLGLENFKTFGSPGAGPGGNPGQPGQAGALSDVDPATLVPGHVTPAQASKAFEEIKDRQNIASITPKALAAFDQAAKEARPLTGGLTGTSVSALIPYGDDTPSQKAFQGLVNTTIKETEGTARQAAFDSVKKNFMPQTGDSDAKIASKRAAFVDYLKSHAASPTNKGFGIDLDKHKSTALPSALSGATVQMRDPKGNIRAVPADQVEAAKAAGGTPL